MRTPTQFGQQAMQVAGETTRWMRQLFPILSPECIPGTRKANGDVVLAGSRVYPTPDF